MRIFGLPDHLATPPPAITAFDDPNRDEAVRQWEDWARAVIRYRVDRRQRVAENPSLQRIERRYCADRRTGPIYWILMYGWIFEPRPRAGGSTDAPFILYRFQIDMILWALDVLTKTLEEDGSAVDGVVSKSRDMGATWIFCALALWGWLFCYPWQIRLVSWRELEVDSNTPDSMFWKISYMLARCPRWMMPEGFDWESNRHHNELTNPENGNAIAGQTSTERSMRGSRATAIIYDEAAINRYFAESWSATANVTDHRFAISSENLDYNTLFHQLTSSVDLDEAEKPSRFPVDYWLHPKHTEEWKEGQKRRMASTPGKFECEVLRNPRANAPTIVYPQSLTKTPEYLPYVPGSPLYIGIDPGYSDETAIVWLQDHGGQMRVINAVTRRKMTADYYGTLIRGTPYLVPPSWIVPEEERVAALAADGTLPSKDWQPCGIDETTGLPEWEYTDEDLELMAWTSELPAPVAIYGDTYGENRFGITKDSFYSRLLRFGLLINRDRLDTGELSAWRKQARTYKGRQEATKEYFPRLVFGNTRGARQCLNAFQAYRWVREERPRTVEPQTPLHDSTSHLVTAVEYVLVNLKIMRDIYLSSTRQKAATKNQRAATRGYLPVRPDQEAPYTSMRGYAPTGRQD